MKRKARRSSTHFAPAERSSEQQIHSDAEWFIEFGRIGETLDSCLDIVAVLNFNRQIVCSNKALVALTDLGAPEALLGLRPGDVLRCIHAGKGPNGCGTSEFCSACGIVTAILNAIEGVREVKECRITRETEGGDVALDLRISVTPLEIGGHRFLVCYLQDISHEKRREALERAFFHDLLNTASGMYSLTEILSNSSAPDPRFMTLLSACARQLLLEITGHRQIVAAERGDLEVNWEPVDGHRLIADLAEQYRRLPAANGRDIRVLDGITQNCTLNSDPALLKRIIGNMLKNALEAAAPGEAVHVGVDSDASSVEFWVANAGLMPREVQLQVFQRSFSTKGAGRGLGAFSMRLLGEQYLRGAISFTSTAGEGTRFAARFPRAALPKARL